MTNNNDESSAMDFPMSAKILYYNIMLKIFIDMFKYAYNLDTEHLVSQMMTSILNCIGYLMVFGICFDMPISNVAGLSLLY